MIVDEQDIIDQARKQLDDERNARKLARVTAALRDLQAAQAVVKQLNNRLQEIASADDDFFD